MGIVQAKVRLSNPRRSDLAPMEVEGIVDTGAPVIFQPHGAFLEATRLAWRELGEPPETHICLVTGRVTAGHGRDDAVYPPWPEKPRRGV